MSDSRLVATVFVSCFVYEVRYGGLAVEDDVLGVTDHEHYTIWLHPALPAWLTLSVLFHEIIHMGLLAYGYSAPNAASFSFCEERVATVAGVILAEALSRSPTLQEFVHTLVAKR